MKHFYALLFLAMLLYTHVGAQVNYSFSATTATYTPVVAGITPPLISLPVYYYGEVDPGDPTYNEGIADSIPLGFTFNYDGIDYNSINIDANGFATLGDAKLAKLGWQNNEDYFINSLSKGPYFDYDGDYPLGSLDRKPVLAPFWDNLYLHADSNMRYATTGAAGSRVFTFEWSHACWDVYDYTTGGYISSPDSAVSFELKLYEGTNVIDFCYKDEGGSPNSSFFASIGLTGTSTQGGGFVSIQNTSVSPAINNIHEADSLSVKPATNQVYRFTPLACKNPLTVQDVSYTNNAVHFSCDTVTGVSRYEFAAVTTPYAPLSGTVQPSTSVTISSLQPDTLYYLYARSYCADSSQSAWIGYQQVKTANNPVALPYYEGFEYLNDYYNYYIPENIRLQNGAWWGSDLDYPELAYDGIRYMIAPVNIFAARDGWFFLPGMNLTVGQLYKFKFHYEAPYALNKLEVKYGKAVDASAMTSGTLFRDTAISTDYGIYVSDSTMFSPATSDTYFIGFHCFSGPGTAYLIIDAISVEDEGLLTVTLINLSGEVNGKQNLLHWTTASEQNNTGFEVQRSSDGINFNKAGFVNTKAINGNSNFKLNYDFADIGFGVGSNYYRLKQIDKDGKFTYSNIVILKDNNALADGDISIYPNPSKNILNIKITSLTNDNLRLSVTDMSGKTIFTKSTLISSGETITQFDVSHLAAGAYYLKLMNTDGSEKAVKKFIKQ